MRSIDVIRLSTRNFRSNRLRTFLTILAVSVATAAILFLVSFGYGLQLLTVQRIANSSTVATIDVLPLSSKSLVKMNKAAIERIKAIPGVLKVAPQIDMEAEAKIQSIGTVVVHGVTPEYLTLADTRLSSGEFFSAEESHRAIVSSGFVAQYGLDKGNKVLSQQFYLTYSVANEQNQESSAAKKVSDQSPFSISGVIKDDDTAYVYVPLQDIEQTVGTLDYVNAKVLASGRDKVIAVKEAINALGYDASAPLETLKQLDRVFAIVQIVLGALGVIALIISSIGMFNTMTISLLERTREIGIMKAIGADRTDIWKLFLTEATIIGFCGGVAGVLIGTALAFVSNTTLNFLARIYGGQPAEIFYSPPWFILAIIIFSTVVGAITGFYPARRAANLNPLKALRYE